MEGFSVSSSASTLIAVGARAEVRAPQTAPDQQVQQAQQSLPAQSTEQVQNNSSDELREAAEGARAEAETSRPSVNSNGQPVGTRVNTTA